MSRVHNPRLNNTVLRGSDYIGSHGKVSTAKKTVMSGKYEGAACSTCCFVYYKVQEQKCNTTGTTQKSMSMENPTNKAAMLGRTGDDTQHVMHMPPVRPFTT